MCHTTPHVWCYRLGTTPTSLASPDPAGGFASLSVDIHVLIPPITETQPQSSDLRLFFGFFCYLKFRKSFSASVILLPQAHRYLVLPANDSWRKKKKKKWWLTGGVKNQPCSHPLKSVVCMKIWFWSIFIGVTIFFFSLPGRSDLQQADVIRGKQ